MSKSMVAIVGRPNVGKSTLFNRLVGRPIAIVEDLPGTTRDRIYGDVSWHGRELALIDTGGLLARPESGLLQQVREQVEIALAEAEAIIFLVDAAEGLTAGDMDIADELRRSQKPVVLVANKADSPRRAAGAAEFYRLGLGEPIPVSAYHGRGVEQLMEALFSRLPSPTPPAEVTELGLPRLAIVGRPNVGKSLLLNAILGQERAIVSEKPGTTRDTLDTVFQYKEQRLLLVDTAGIRRSGRVEPGVERYSVLRAMRAIARADVALLVTEASEFIAAQDLHIAGYIHQACKGMVLVVNKWDLVPKKEEAPYIEVIRQRLRFMPYVPVVFVSAKDGTGVERVLPLALDVYAARFKRLTHVEVGQVVEAAVAAHNPPVRGRRRLRIFSATQTEVNPPTFVFAVNNPGLMTSSYERYLENRLREAFGFVGTPLRLLFKSRGRR